MIRGMRNDVISPAEHCQRMQKFFEATHPGLSRPLPSTLWQWLNVADAYDTASAFALSFRAKKFL